MCYIHCRHILELSQCHSSLWSITSIHALLHLRAIIYGLEYSEHALFLSNSLLVVSKMHFIQSSFLLALPSQTLAATYSISSTAVGPSFYDAFSFIADPTSGTVFVNHLPHSYRY